MASILPALLGAGVASVGAGMLDAEAEKKAKEQKFNTEILRAGIMNRIQAGDVSVFDNPDIGKAVPKQSLDVMKAITQAIAQGKAKDQAAVLDMARKLGFIPEPGAQPKTSMAQPPAAATPGAVPRATAPAPAGLGAAPVLAPAQVPDSVWTPLQPRRSMTIDPKTGAASFTLSQPTNEEVEKHASRQADAIFAAGFIQNNPDLASRIPGLQEGVSAGSPAALAIVKDFITKHGYQPSSDQLRDLYATADPGLRALKALQLYGGDGKKAAEALKVLPAAGGPVFDPKEISPKVRDEVMRLAAERKVDISKGVPQDLYKDGFAAALQRHKEERQQTFDQATARAERLFKERANVQVIAGAAKNVVSKVAEDENILDRAKTIRRQVQQAFDLMANKGFTTNIRALDLPVQKIAGFLQAGKTGQAAALIEGLRTEYASVEQRILGMGLRPGVSITQRIETTLPNIGDTAAVKTARFTRIDEILKSADRGIARRKERALKLLDSNPNLKDATDAFRQGYLDNAGELLRARAADQTPLPVIQYGSGDFEESK